MKLTFLTHINRHRIRQNETEEFVLMKEQDKITARDLSKTEISNVPNREFQVMVIKILPGLEKTVEDLIETLNKERENIKNESEMKNSITEIENTLGGINSRLEEAKEQTSDLEDRVMESNQAEWVREKKYKMRIDLGNSATPSSITKFML